MRWQRHLHWISLAGTAVFLGCYVAAAAIYPGGSWMDPDAPGHSLWTNFLCDLMQRQALNGEPTPWGAALARIGMLAMLAAVAAFFTQVAQLETPPSRIGTWTVRTGLTACVLGILIPLVPSDLWRLGHLIVVVTAFIPGLLATCTATHICVRSPGIPRGIRAIAVVTIVAGAVDCLLYLYAYTAPVLGLLPESRQLRILLLRALPFFQRIATVGVVMLVCTTAWAFAARSRSITPPAR